MDIQETQHLLTVYLQELANLFHRIPGSAIVLRYIKSSYQDDPVRSAVEFFLFLFAVRYLMAPKYSTKPGVVKLSEDEVDDLVDEWTPEPLVGEPTALEALEVEKRPVIVRLVSVFFFFFFFSSMVSPLKSDPLLTLIQSHRSQMQTRKRTNSCQSRIQQ